MLAPLLVLASVLVPALASASLPAQPETRVRGFDLAGVARVGLEGDLSRTSRQAYGLWYGGTASGSLVAPKSGVSVGKWTGKEVRGRTVFQRNDIFDPLAVDEVGLTNMQRMGAGRSPIGYDGRPVNLHHLTQMEPGSLAEVPGQLHSQYTKQLHGLVEPKKSFRYSPESGTTAAEKAFKQYGRRYWQERAKDFQQ